MVKKEENDSGLVGSVSNSILSALEFFLNKMPVKVEPSSNHQFDV